MPLIDAKELSAADAYRLLVGIVVPRPIAWITTLDGSGRVNAAPFSCYTFVCNRPPMLAINLGRRDGTLKDTARNVRQRGDFVVNVVTEALIAPMHQSSSDFAPEISEPSLLGIELAPSRLIDPPRIAASPIALECRLDRIIELGEQANDLVIGRVVAFNINDDIYADGRVDMRKFRPLARLGGPHYAYLGEIITMPSSDNFGPRPVLANPSEVP
ncbi:MAG TPA: flavin reductase family protein [Stellaceae bacterium]|nr:flavin reductase family protein [Stellaceae bacterium]